MFRNEIKRIVIFVIIILVLGGGFILWKGRTVDNGQLPENNGQPAKNEEQSVITFSKPVFAAYQLEKTEFKPSLPNYSLALSDITNLSSFGSFSKNQTSTLSADNFFIASNGDNFYKTDPNTEVYSRIDDWTDLYGVIGGPYSAADRRPQNSVFITSDFLLHVYHRLLEKEFEYIEQNNFYPTLRDLSTSLLKSSVNSYSESTSTQKESYERLSTYFLIPVAILGTAAQDYGQFEQYKLVTDSQNDSKSAALSKVNSLAAQYGISDNARNIAREEIELIFGADLVAMSPLFGKYQQEQDLFLPEDYTQFGPRSHYAKNAILRTYFRAMMWYGRTNFLLSSPELTRDAVNIVSLISSDDFKKWESIYLPTSFFVGQSDDLGIYEYGQAVQKIGIETGDFDQNVLGELQTELKSYKNPQIMSSFVVGFKVFDTTKEDLQAKTKGFRFMGQRFTPDAFVFSTLTQGQELPDSKTGQSLPSRPTALMVSTLMGSKVSGNLLDEWIEENASDSDKVIAERMASLKDYFDGVSQSQWTQNIYWSWLYTLKSVMTEDVAKTGYPMFVKNQDWDKKNLQCFLGSWTELKHDTLLYAKQSYAELGAGGDVEEPQPVPKGYVEPNIEFFDRLIALVDLSKNGLEQLGLLPAELGWRNDTLTEKLQFFRRIAVAELQNEKISDEDFEKLRLSAGSLGSILRPLAGGLITEKDARSALIADVHTDAVKGEVLYEADGIPNYIYVAVKDTNGTRLTKGLVYSYYEFTGPLGKRLTDADWQKWVYTDKSQVPAMSDWNKALIK